MPNCTGQKPIVGDAVCDKDRRFGRVTHIIHYGAGPAELVIEWNDGTIGIRYFRHQELMLIERRDCFRPERRRNVFPSDESRIIRLNEGLKFKTRMRPREVP